MKNIIYLCLAAACLLSAAIAEETLNCPGLTSQSTCDNNSSTCTWNSIDEKNTCIQSQDCSAVTVADCTNATYTNYCQTTGFGSCSDNTTYCTLNGTTCPTGCTSGVTDCQAVTGGFKCSDLTATTNACDSLNYCEQDSTKTPLCTASIETCSTTPQAAACSGPCDTASVACVNNGKCDVTNPTAATCTTANGCTFSETDSTCTYADTCSTLNTAAGCSGSTSCQISTYTCQNSATSIATYCTNNLATCNTDATVQAYCTYNVNKSCIDVTSYCTAGATPNGCALNSEQCTVTQTCTNPQTDKCTGYTTAATCVENLCNSSPGACENKTTDAECNDLKESSTDCATGSGCSFTQGGVCSTNESGTTNSGLKIAFSSALIGLALAL